MSAAPCRVVLICFLSLNLLPAGASGAGPTKVTPAAPADDDLVAFLKAPPSRSDPGAESWAAFRLPQPKSIARAVASNGLPAVLQALQKQFNLGPEAARSLVVSWWWWSQIWEHPDRSQFDARSGQLRSALSAASQAAPGNLALAIELVINSERMNSQERWPAELVFAHIEHSREPVALAMSLARASRETSEGPRRPTGELQLPLLAYAAMRDPRLLEEASRLARQAGPSYDLGPTAFALGLMRIAESTHPPVRIKAQLVSLALENLLQNGFPVAAAEVYDAVSADVKAMTVGLRPRSPDWRPGLAAALLVTGHPREQVRHLVETFPEVEAGVPPDGENHCPPRFERDVLSFHFRGNRPVDGFDIAVDALSCQVGAQMSWSILVAPLIESQYPALAQRMLRGPGSPADEQGRVDSTVIPPQLKELYAPAMALVSKSIERQHQLLQTAIEAFPKEQPGNGGHDPAAVAIAKVMKSTPQQDFSEHDIVAGAPVGGDVAANPELPKGFDLVRAEKHGERVVAIALSQRVDSTGEVSSGGYWLLESRDDGRRWERPVYLGLRQYLPYEVVPSSRLPLVEGDVLRIEVQRRELDASTITFPPVGMRAVTTRNGFYLEARLADLKRDTDGDGLTDLLEDRLLLDPTNADTDGDGIPDGRDPLPNVSSVGKGGAPAALMSEILERIGRGQGRVRARILTPSSQPNGHDGAEGDPSRAAGVPALVDDAPVEFIVGDRADFCGLAPSVQTIVLTPEEAERAAQRFQVFFPLRLTVIVDRSGRRAYIESNEGWRGATFKATKSGGEWVLKVLSEWIT